MEQTIVGKPHTYVIRNPLTETNCSRTYLAKDEDTKRKVFIKAIDVPQECRERRAVLEDAVREAQAMIRVGAETHRVPTVYEYFHDEVQKVFYIVMQNIPGKTLGERMTELDEGAFLRVMRDVASVLVRMHNPKGPHYYHRDLKPDNIIVGKYGDGYLVDFGSSVSYTLKDQEGTPGYRAPEMTRRLAMESRSGADIFSMGVILYEYYTQVRPAMGRNREYMANRDGSAWEWFKEPAALQPRLPAPVNALIVKCMRLNPKERGDAKDLERALDALLRRARNGGRGYGRVQ